MSNEVKAYKPYVRPSVVEDIPYLAENIREADQLEIWHLARILPIEAFTDGFESSDAPLTVVWGDKPVAMFGVTGVKGIGVPWMLATDDLVKIRKSFLRECKRYLDEMHKVYPYLTNQVWAKNTVHIQWLKWMGFTFETPYFYGPDNELFIEFHKEA